MATRSGKFFMTLLLLFFVCVGFEVSAISPESAPSPAPGLPADSPTPASDAPNAGAPVPVSGSPNSSPPSPPPETHAPDSSPASSPPSEKSPAPAPSPDVSDINHSDMNVDGEEQATSSGGMSGGKKAGIAVGVVALACLVGLGGFVYKKRQDNLRRSQYGYAARRELL